MQRRRRAVKSDIGGNARLLRQRVQRLGFRDLVNEAAFGQDAQEICFVCTIVVPWSDLTDDTGCIQLHYSRGNPFTVHVYQL